jgi:hypothetical protein
MQSVGFNSARADLTRKSFRVENVTDDELNTLKELLHSLKHFLGKIGVGTTFDACDSFGCLCSAESMVI